MHLRRFKIASVILAGPLTLFITARAFAPVAPAPGQLAHDVPGLTTPAAQALASPNPALSARPLKVWECVSGWYGEPFNGQQTATGEVYDMYARTAAHPTLPLGSWVRVVNLMTHRSQVVRINDRGPFVEGRGLDVSYGVARYLGFEERGLARVRIELLEVPRRLTSHPID